VASDHAAPISGAGRRSARRPGLTRRIAATAAAAALVVGAAACSSSGSSSGSGASSGASSATSASSSFPVTVTASNGKITLGAEPKRIVSLSPTATEDLFQVGAGSQVVAVDDESDYPANAPVTKLSGLDPNAEAIIGYDPDLVVVEADANGLLAALAKVHVPVLVEPAAATLADAYAEIDQIGLATGHLAKAQQTVASMKTAIDGYVKQAGSNHAGLSYYWELSANPYYSATSSTFIGQIVGLFGLRNIADAADKASDGGYPELSEEYIVAAQPQIIFLADNEAADGGQSPAVVAARPGWSAVPAVKSGEIIPLNDDVASRWGPRLPQMVQQIAQAVEQVRGT
jgi:iron complex transport system substrate-binding protein